MTRHGKRAAVLVSGLAATLGLPAQGTAHATSWTVYTSPSTYGYATFNTSTGGLYVNDTYADGRRIVADVWNESLGGALVVHGQDTNGSNNGGVTSYGSWFESGDVLTIQICRRNGTAPSTDDRCNERTVIV
ncbi:hypothetical protein [Streptomyces regalis]|uniref:Uncharacterized protein n=1 Tax=Streptomyces regalis TaxID=68262 RepID=A0A101JA01_9ACTN|nr:hypothetical protein [Streptomyces regalis]KUL22937.1 hypothetical protein ADL12_40925 [Streptomyces regalis]